MPDIIWLLAGWGPIVPETWGLSNVRVERGRSGETLAPLYQVADLLVLPSVGEGFPLVIQEAISCGLPVLCTPETALADPATTGFVFSEPLTKDLQESVSRWKERILSLLRTLPQEFAGELAHQHAVEHWSWYKTAEEDFQVISEQAARGSKADKHLRMRVSKRRNSGQFFDQRVDKY